MKTPSIRIVVTVAAALAAGHLQAQTVSATATLSDVPGTAGVFDYTLTVFNTGTAPIEGVWYGWLPGGNTLPSDPTAPGSLSAWSPTLSGGNSIMFQGNSSDAIGAGQSGIFTFDSTSTLAQMTSGTTGPGATGASVAFATTIGFTGNSPGVSAEFTPTAVPEPSTVGLFALGSAGMLARGWRKLRR